MSNVDFTRGFTDIGTADRPLVGGKAASLGELISAGVRVPPGCVVTTIAFERALRLIDPAGGIRGAIERLDPGDPGTIARVTADIRHRIETAALPEELGEAIAERYRELSSGSDLPAGAPVAVRSSATSEDSAEASFAGLQDTHLWVRGEEPVISCVRRCWASLYNVESVSYRLRLKLPEEHLAMGVVIQRMVDPRCAGVMFTRSPTTGDRSVVVIEASWGLGSAIVSGEVTPDAYTVSKVTGEIIRRTVSTKLRQHRVDPGGSGVVEEEVPVSLQAQACVTDDEIRELVRVARGIEKHYGAPQDIEWAIAANLAPGENVFVLQSRPETVWSSREAAPVAVPKSRPFDHVFGLLGGGGSPDEGRDPRR